MQEEEFKVAEEEEGSSFEVEQVSPPAAASSTFDFKALLFPQVLDPGSKEVENIDYTFVQLMLLSLYTQ